MAMVKLLKNQTLFESVEYLNDTISKYTENFLQRNKNEKVAKC